MKTFLLFLGCLLMAFEGYPVLGKDNDGKGLNPDHVARAQAELKMWREKCVKKGVTALKDMKNLKQVNYVIGITNYIKHHIQFVLDPKTNKMLITYFGSSLDNPNDEPTCGEIVIPNIKGVEKAQEPPSNLDDAKKLCLKSETTELKRIETNPPHAGIQTMDETIMDVQMRIEWIVDHKTNKIHVRTYAIPVNNPKAGPMCGQIDAE